MMHAIDGAMHEAGIPALLERAAALTVIPAIIGSRVTEASERMVVTVTVPTAADTFGGNMHAVVTTELTFCTASPLTRRASVPALSA